jgi:hypothetical protein
MLKTLFATASALLVSIPLAASPRQLARFEHVYTVLDQDTAQAIRDSAYLRDFCGVQEKTTQSDEGHYHGTYILGRENYVELFGPADVSLDGPPAAVGLIGMGLNTERLGGLEPLKRAIEENNLPVEIRTFHKTFNGRTVDWFKGLAPAKTLDNQAEKSPLPTAEIFVAEFIPSYFEVPEADKPPSLGPRDLVSLARYHRRDYAGKLLKNVTAVEVAITHEDWRALRATLAGAGYTLTEDGTEARAAGDVELKFQFVDRPQQMGLRRVNFSLNSKPGTQHVEVLGRSRLVVGPGANAVWTF